MQSINNHEEKRQALGRIKELTEKLNGQDSEVEALKEELKQHEETIKNLNEKYKDLIASAKDKIKNAQNATRKGKADLENELKGLKQALVDFELAQDTGHDQAA